MAKDCECDTGCLVPMVIVILLLVWGISETVDTVVTKIDNLEKKIESIK